MTASARKADTYRKIQLGGLVIKAGGGEFDKALILGILIDGFSRAHDGAALAQYRAIGQAAFEEKT